MAKATLVSGRLIRLLFQVHLHPIHSLCFKWIDELWGESLGPRSPKLWSKSQEYYDCFFWRLCVCLSSSDHAGGYSFWLSALMFAHLCSCSRSHKHRWNTVRWQQPSLIATHDTWTASCKSHSSGKAHAMVSFGTAVGAILLKELLGHGLATHNGSDKRCVGDSSPKLPSGSVLCAAKLSS